jgi:hypothetical protein
MQTSNTSEPNRRGDFIRVKVRAENPASRIQVTDAEGRYLLAVPATGQVRVNLRRGATYFISHWIGSGEQHVREWNAGRDAITDILLPDDTLFVSAQPLPNSDQQDAESLQFAGQSLPSAVDGGPGSDRAIYLSARLRHSGHDAVRRRNDLLQSLQAVNIGWLDDDEYHVRVPRPVGRTALESSNALLQYDIQTAKVGRPILAISPPQPSPDWIFRTVPMLERRFPRVFLCGVIGRQEEASRIDWRRARYSLYLSSDSDERYLPAKEARCEEGLIERLGRPGVVSAAIRQFVQDRESGNVLAQIAGWLLSARQRRPAFQPRHDILTAFRRWQGLKKAFFAIPDAEVLEYYWEAEDYKYLNLSAPVFSASWRLLAHIPGSAWLKSKVSIDPLSWRIANSANVGALWFSWTPGRYRSLESEDEQLNGAVAKGPEAFIRLVQRVQDAARESSLDSEQFSQLLSWTSRTLLERRILDQVLARGAIVPEHEGAAEQMLDEFARVLGFPLPIVALSVGKLAGQEWNSEIPPPTPGNLPTEAALPEVASVVQHEEVYAKTLGGLTGFGMSTPLVSLPTSRSGSPISLDWTYPHLRELLR